MRWNRNGCELAYDDRGDGVPVVLTHGAGADRRMFDDLGSALVTAGYQVITWDQRNHGQSRPSSAPFSASTALEDLAGLIAHVGLDRPVLIGQSLGGNLSQAAIRSDPTIARALVVIDSAWNTGPLTWLDRQLLKLAGPSLSLVPERRLARLMADASAVTAGARAYALAAFGAMPKRDFVEVWSATVSLLDPDPEYRTPVPLLLIRGDADRTGNIASAMPRWAAAEGITELVIPIAGHLANMDAPAIVNAAVLEFLGGL